MTPDLTPGAPPAGAFGRVAIDGDEHDCRYAGDLVELLDRPAWDPRARVVGEAPLGAAQILAPVVPGKILAVGFNYRAHAAELATTVQAEPVLFLKPGTSVIAPGQTIVRPARSSRVDYEAELVIVVGRRGKDFTPAEAAAYVAGYTCGNDVTARDLVKIGDQWTQWTRAKGFDTFCPLGPWVVPGTPSPATRVRGVLDGVVVQDGCVGDMVVGPLELLAFASGIMTLEPGDVLMTGTPPGVGPLAAGQTVTVVVEGVGELSNPVA